MMKETTRLRCEDLCCDDLVVVDVRTPAEYREVHIPGSVNVPLGDLPKRISEICDRAQGRPVALVCRTGRRADSAHDELRGRAPGGVHVLEGGIASWLDQERPVNRGRKAVSIERQVRIAAGFMAAFGVALGYLVHPAFHALAAFVGAGLVFSGVTDTCGMAMILARMPWNRSGAKSGSAEATPAASTAGSEA